MILDPLHPLAAPSMCWFMGDKQQAFKLWFRLLRPAVYSGDPNKPETLKVNHRWDIRKIPWCGWKQFWLARPWR